MKNPYPNEHSVRYRSPKKYVRFVRKNDFFGKGVDVVFGITKNRSLEVQAVRFRADIWKLSEVKGMVKKPSFRKIGKPMFIERAVRKNPPMNEAEYKKLLQRFLDDEQKGIKRYKEFLLRLPLNPDANKVSNVLRDVIKDEENHERILLRLLFF